MSIEHAFALLEQAAITGSRCPQGDVIPSRMVTALARAGHILVEVYVHNYRVVTILTGPNAGKETAPPPKPQGRQRSTPYKIVGKETRVNGRVQETYETRTLRAGPSTPKDYSVAHGLRDLKERGR